MSKGSDLSVPRLLTNNQKHTRLVMSQTNLALFQQFQPAFFNVSLSKMSVVSTKKAKVKAFVFRDANDIVFIDFLQKGQTINGEYCANLLRQMRKAITSKRPGKLKKGVLFHRNNAPAYKSVVAMGVVRDCGFELFDYPPYSPDLIPLPSDYFAFPNMKKTLSWEAVSDR